MMSEQNVGAYLSIVPSGSCGLPSAWEMHTARGRCLSLSLSNIESMTVRAVTASSWSSSPENCIGSMSMMIASEWRMNGPKRLADSAMSALPSANWRFSPAMS